MNGKQAQIISAIQRKGGACKSTMLQCIGAKAAKDHAKVLLIDTDPQASCVEWAGEQDIEGVDILPHLDEDTILDVLEKVRGAYDLILIDTAGYDSRMASYVIQASDLILIPTGGSKSNVMGAARTWKHATVSTQNSRTPPEIRVVFWGVKNGSKVHRHAAEAMEQTQIPIVPAHVGLLTGFEAMSWNGGLPNGVAAIALNGFMTAMQEEGLLDYYKDDEDEDENEEVGEVINGQAA